MPFPVELDRTYPLIAKANQQTQNIVFGSQKNHNGNLHGRDEPFALGVGQRIGLEDPSRAFVRRLMVACTAGRLLWLSLERVDLPSLLLRMEGRIHVPLSASSVVALHGSIARDLDDLPSVGRGGKPGT